ncbi:MAG: hypothetical protein KBS36_05495 [Bacteroidales bacterium]|nr:hypothetical protein [Candidatus Cryptobacteroides fimicaballi]
MIDKELKDYTFIFTPICVPATVELYDFRNVSVEPDPAIKVCSLDDTLYSWRNARLAVVDGTVVGCLVSYDGAIYQKTSKRTFSHFADAGRSMDSTETGPELRDYYSFLGFRPGHELNAFRDKYLKMINEI